MLKPAEAERITGYRVGGISPFGQKKRVRVFIETAAMNHAHRDLQRRAARLADRIAAGASLCGCSTRHRRRFAHERARPAHRASISRSMAASPSPGALPGWRSIIRSAWSRRKSRCCGASSIAAPFMLLIAAIRGEQLRFPLRDHLWLALLGLTLFCTNFALFYYAAQWITSGLLSVVFALASIINIVLGALLLGTPIDRRTVIGAVLGVGGLAAMFYPQLAGTDLNSQMLIGIALSVAGTFSFCFGNMISAQLQRRRLPIFATTGIGMIYGACFLAMFAAFRGHAFIIEPTARYVISLLYLGADRLGAGLHLLSDVARPDRRRSRRLCDRDVSGRRACRLDRIRRLSLDPARGPWRRRRAGRHRSGAARAEEILSRLIPPPAPPPTGCRATTRCARPARPRAASVSCGLRTRPMRQ